MTDDTALPETSHVAGYLCQWLCEQIWGEMSPIRLDGESFRPAYDEEFRELGYPEDVNDVLLLRRESDGAFFEIDLDADVLRVRPGDYEARLQRLRNLISGSPEAAS